MRTFYVYILANRARVIYVGVTGALISRIWRHRFARGSRFTSRYGVTRLVHYEVFEDARSAIAREKDLKRRHRSYKVRLIEQGNPDWLDLAAFWFD